MPVFRFSTPSLKLHLKANQLPRAALEKRKVVDCHNNQKSQLDAARSHASLLAHLTRTLHFEEGLWVEYNNGNQGVLKLVREVYDYIETYRVGSSSDHGVKEKCMVVDLTKDRFQAHSRVMNGGYYINDDCGAGVAAYTDEDEGDPIVFCDYFFKVIPSLRECEAPGPANRNMMDQAGIMLHELTHCYSSLIHDGEYISF